MGVPPHAKFCKNRRDIHFAFGANLHQKLPILAILGAKSPQFQNHKGDVWRDGANLEVVKIT